MMRYYPYVGATEFAMNYCETDPARDKFAIRFTAWTTPITVYDPYVYMTAYAWVYSTVVPRPRYYDISIGRDRSGDWVTAWRLRLSNLRLKHFCHDYYQPAKKVPWR
jgi:hypothetical protein